MKYIDEYRDSESAKKLVIKLKKTAETLSQETEINIMEVCGSHTMAIARYGIRDVLPDSINLISGPGCPVCVTDAGYIDTAIKLAESGKIIATFGDMLNVPGSEKSLSDCRLEGARIEVCYSPTNAIEIAENNRDDEVIFLAIGFETTTAPVISLIDMAVDKGLKNVSLLVSFKTVPPALNALISDPEVKVDAFLCPAHVSAIIGSKAYEPFAKKCNIPCVIAGFEPLDILYGVYGILEQLSSGNSFVDNQYSRVVKPDGNILAQKLIDKYLCIADVSWRGIGVIPDSGMELRNEYRSFDSTIKFGIDMIKGSHDKKCRCGDVLKGKISPDKCTLFGKVCSPVNPVGPCMVSSEGSCSAYYKYCR